MSERTTKEKTELSLGSAVRADSGAPPSTPTDSCRNGHAMTEANSKTDAKGHRRCRECLRDKSRKQRAEWTGLQPWKPRKACR
jgi:hypothetical protein